MTKSEQVIQIAATDLEVDDVIIGGVAGVSEPEVVFSVTPVERLDGSVVVYFETDAMKAENSPEAFLYGDRVVVVIRSAN